MLQFARYENIKAMWIGILGAAMFIIVLFRKEQ
jgi:hypothetical protein